MKPEKEIEWIQYPYNGLVPQDELEFGDRVSGALYRENAGPDWMRRMILAVRSD
jgi:hypothetical protein